MTTPRLTDFQTADDWKVLAAKLLDARVACVNTLLCVIAILEPDKDSRHFELCKLIETTRAAVDIQRLYQLALAEAAEAREHA